MSERFDGAALVVKDAELRYTKDGASVITFRISPERDQFMRVTVWHDSHLPDVDWLCENVRKGAKVYVAGPLKIDSQYGSEVTAYDFGLIWRRPWAK